MATMALALLVIADTAGAGQVLSRSRVPESGRIGAGVHHTCALLADGTVRCWGSGWDGRLGYGNTARIGDDEPPSAAGPVDVGGRVRQLAVGMAHACALRVDGRVVCWGSSSSGQLGYGSEESVGDNEVPASAGPVDLGGRVRSISAGYNHTCALLVDGTVRCWGFGADGRLGYGVAEVIGDDETPGALGPVPLGGSAVAVSAGGDFTCALLVDGTVRCWGSGYNGQLGDGETRSIGDDELPTAIPPVALGDHRATAIAAGNAHACAVLDDGSVRCWGFGQFGQLGDGDTRSIGDDELPSSVPPVSLGRPAIAIAAGGYHTCAVLDDGAVRCWGENAVGQLGLGEPGDIGDDELPSSVPPLDFGGHRATDVATGYYHSCVSLDDGSMRCWGWGGEGQLGTGAGTDVIGDDEGPDTGAIALGSPLAVASLTAGGAHTCARLDDGTGRCWGNGAGGRLGYGNLDDVGDDETLVGSSPLDVGAARHPLRITAGGAHTCALLADGSVRCWGSGTDGRLGYGNVDDVGDDETPAAVDPVDLGSGRKAIAITAGGAHTCALLDDGTVRCWGSGADGRLGYGNTDDIGDDEAPGAVGPLDFIDDPAVAIDDSFEIEEDAGPQVLDLWANDVDDGGPREAVVSVTEAVRGTVTVGERGSAVTYEPPADYCNRPPGEEPDTFAYTLARGSTATVSVLVDCIDDPPEARDDTVTIAMGSVGSRVEVLANDLDVDGGPIAVAGSADGDHGEVAVLAGGEAVSYSPQPGFCGADEFPYTLNGGSSARVRVTVVCAEPGVDRVGDGIVGVGQTAGDVVSPAASGRRAHRGAGQPLEVTAAVGMLGSRRGGLVWIRGRRASFRLACLRGAGACRGVVRVTAALTRHRIRRRGAGAAHDVVLVRRRFRIVAGRRVLLRANLTGRGERALRGIGVLREIRARLTIRGPGPGGRGAVAVGLVRRPRVTEGGIHGRSERVDAFQSDLKEGQWPVAAMVDRSVGSRLAGS